MNAAVDRAPDLAALDKLITELEAQAQRDVRTGRSVLDRHPARESARSALLAEFEGLASSLRAVDAKVVEWRERAQRAEGIVERLVAAFDRRPTLNRIDVERGSLLMRAARDVLASVPASQRNDEETR